MPSRWHLLLLLSSVSATPGLQDDCPIPRVYSQPMCMVPFPERSCYTCGVRQKMWTQKKMDGAVCDVKVSFKNAQATDSVTIFRVSLDGTEVQEGAAVLPGQITRVTGCEGEVFRGYRTSDKSLLIEHMLGIRVITNVNNVELYPPAPVVIPVTTPAPGKPAAPAQLPPPAPVVPEAKGWIDRGGVKPDERLHPHMRFYNSLPVPVAMWFPTGNPQLSYTGQHVMEIAPGAIVEINSYVGDIILFTTIDGQELQRYPFSEIVIRDCQVLKQETVSRPVFPPSTAPEIRNPNLASTISFIQQASYAENMLQQDLSMLIQTATGAVVNTLQDGNATEAMLLHAELEKTKERLSMLQEQLMNKKLTSKPVKAHSALRRK